MMSECTNCHVCDDADTIVARNFLRAVAAGTTCYIHVVETTARNLKCIGENNGIVKGKYTLNKLEKEIMDRRKKLGLN